MNDFPNDKYGRTVVMNSDGIQDIYTVTDSQGNSFNLAFPAGTDLTVVYAAINANETLPDLATAKVQKIAAFKADVDAYIDARYSITVRQQFLTLYVLANADGLTNRAAYCRQLGDWADSIIVYSSQFMAMVQAQTDVAAVLIMSWNIDANIILDPKVTLSTAIQIMN